IERSQYADLIEENRQRVKEKYETYRRRQAIVEHPFGIIKRQCNALSLSKWGFNYIMTKKTKQSASADVGLIFTAYNLRRIFNILSPQTLKEYLRELSFNLALFKSYFKPQTVSLIFHPNFQHAKSNIPKAAKIGNICIIIISFEGNSRLLD